MSFSIKKLIVFISAITLLAFIGLVYYTSIPVKGLVGEGSAKNSFILGSKGSLIIPQEFNGKQLFASNENISFYVDKKNGHFDLVDNKSKDVYSSNNENQADRFAKDKWKTNLKSHLMLEYTNSTGKEKSIVNSYSGAFVNGEIKTEKINNGVRILFNFREFKITIPLELILTEDGLAATITYKDIVSESKDFIVTKIHILPFLMSNKSEKKGFLFVPDGSGSIIDTSISKPYNSGLNLKVYGNNDLVFIKEKKPFVDVGTRIPVFGIGNENSALMSVISDGDGVSEIQAYSANSVTEMNNVYPIFKLNSVDSYFINDRNGQPREISVVDNKRFNTEQLQVRYFLISKSTPTFLDFAKRYTTYLTREKNFNKSRVNSKRSVFIDLYGAVQKNKSFLGLPIVATEPLTTFKEANDIIAKLKGNGVSNIKLEYRNLTKEQIEKISTDKFQFLSALGNKGEFETLIGKVDDFYVTSDAVNIKKFGILLGTVSNNIQNISGLPVFGYKYDLSNGYRNEKNRWNILPPDLSAMQISKFTESVSKYNSKLGVSIEFLGSNLYSSFSKKPFNRETTKDIFIEAFKKSSSKTKIMAENANAYTFNFVDYMRDAPYSSSKYSIEDMDVPFYQSVAKNFVNFTGEALNLSSDVEIAFLKTVDYGGDLHYTFFGSDPSKIISTELENLYSCNFNSWFDSILIKNSKLQKLDSVIQNSELIEHRSIASGVIMNVYSNGVVVAINYGDSDYFLEKFKVQAKNYLVLKNGEVIE